MVIAQHTMRQSQIDLANTREYRQAHVLGQLAAVEGQAQTLALESPRPVSPQGRGQGYTQRADRYYVQKAVGTPASELTLNAMRLATPEDYHSAREPSEFKFESEGSEGPGTDSMGYSSTTTATSYHDMDNTQHSDTKNRDHKCWRQKHRDRREHWSTNAQKQRDPKNGWVVLPLFQESTKEGTLTYTDWRLEVEEYIVKKYPGLRSKRRCSPPWKARLREIIRPVMRRGVFAEMLLDNGMIPTITKLTRISKTTATLIDYILVSEDLQETFNCGILIDNSSDHLPCYTTLENILLSKKVPTRITGRDMRPKCLDRLKEKLKNEEWNIDHNLSLNENFKNFHNNLIELVDHFLPITNRIVCTKTLRREPWLTPGIMKSINKCKQLYHKMLKNETPTSRTKYTEYNSTLQKIKRHAHKYYFESKCAENKSNTKELWQLINKAAGKISDKTSIIEIP